MTNLPAPIHRLCFPCMLLMQLPCSFGPSLSSLYVERVLPDLTRPQETLNAVDLQFLSSFESYIYLGQVVKISGNGDIVR
jgi:hypothetical protein